MVRGANSAAGHKSRVPSRGQVAPVEPHYDLPVMGGRALLQSGPLRWMSQALAFAGVITVSASLGAALALLSPVPLLPQASGKIGLGDFFKTGFQYGVSRPVNILVMGIDQGFDRDKEKGKESDDIFNSRSDTMLLIRLNPEDQKVSLLTIPRDTQVNIPGLGVEKINAANWKGGPEMAAEVVSHTLNNVDVDRYLRINTRAFRDLVDVVGGVEVFVPQVMKYDDNTQNLHIDLKPGLQTLTGQQAEGFVRFRKDDLGDIGRTQRQQTLIKALQKKFQNPLMLARIPEVFSVLQKHIDSNLSLGEMLAMAQFGMNVKPSQLQMVMLPGRFSAPDEFELSYWLMDPTAASRVMKTYFDVEPNVGADPQLDAASQAAAETNPADVKVIVQNASEDPEGSHRMADYLIKIGFSNVEVEADSPEPLETTQVIPQWGHLDIAKQLQQKISTSEVNADSTGNLRSDITIRVGRDWVKRDRANTAKSSG